MLECRPDIIALVDADAAKPPAVAVGTAPLDEAAVGADAIAGSASARLGRASGQSVMST